MMTEIKGSTYSGYTILAVLFIGIIACVPLVIVTPPIMKIAVILTFLFMVFCLFGFFMVGPNQGRVLQLFGKYVGTEKNFGLRWANPLYSKTKISLKIRNFESSRIKVNDLIGNPIEIASVIVWRVVDTAEAVFEVDDYIEFVSIQTEAAIRNMATRYPYDDHEEGDITIRGSAAEISDILKAEVQERLGKAGVEVLEARISHLAYAPEIASAMLQRQQATAIVAARHKIVEGAVGMVESALEKLSERNIVELDNERKAAMVSSLLVVLCGDKSVQPIINTGTLYT